MWQNPAPYEGSGSDCLARPQVSAPPPGGASLKGVGSGAFLPRDKARKALQFAREEGFVAQDPLSKKYLIRYPHPFLELPEAPEDPYFYQELAKEAYQHTGHRAYVLTLRPWGIHPEATYGHRGQRVWPVPGEQGPVTPMPTPRLGQGPFWPTCGKKP